MINCCICREQFNNISTLTKHLRHKHTDYDKMLNIERDYLKGARGLTELQRTLLSKEQVRMKIDDRIKNLIALSKSMKGNDR